MERGPVARCGWPDRSFDVSSFPLALSLLVDGCMTGPAAALPLAGTWGAPQAGLELTADGGRLEEGCGEIVMGPLRPDPQGRFSVTGRQTLFDGGPQRVDEPTATQPVRITGRVEGEMLTLAIAAPSQPSRELVFQQGRRGKIIHCY